MEPLLLYTFDAAICYWDENYVHSCAILNYLKGQNEVEEDYSGVDSQWLDMSWISR